MLDAASGSLGFPLDLTEIMAEQIGMTVDKEGYEAELKKEADKNTGKGGEGQKDMLFQSKETVWLGNENIAVTNQAGKYTTGSQPEATVLAIFTGRGALPSEKGFQPSASADDEVVGFILDSTPFYPEAGGQVPDTGTLTSAGKAVSVSDVQVYAGYVLHIGTITGGTVAVGDVMTCAVDYDRREKIAPNHTMTHVLNYALRKVLLGGPNDEEEKKGKISQKGSHVDENRLRFDFGWDKPVSTEQMAEVERLVNEQIGSNLQVRAGSLGEPATAATPATPRRQRRLRRSLPPPTPLTAPQPRPRPSHLSPSSRPPPPTHTVSTRSTTTRPLSPRPWRSTVFARSSERTTLTRSVW